MVVLLVWFSYVQVMALETESTKIISIMMALETESTENMTIVLIPNAQKFSLGTMEQNF